MLFVAVDPIAEAISVCCYGYVLMEIGCYLSLSIRLPRLSACVLWVCIKETGCYLSQSIRLPRLSACVVMGMY